MIKLTKKFDVAENIKTREILVFYFQNRLTLPDLRFFLVLIRK